MKQAVSDFVLRFMALSEGERQEVFTELLHQVQLEEHDLPSDDDLTTAADRLFQDLERREKGI